MARSTNPSQKISGKKLDLEKSKSDEGARRLKVSFSDLGKPGRNQLSVGGVLE